MLFHKTEKILYSPKNDFAQYIPNIKNQNIKLYITNRVLRQIDWYDQKSNHNQKFYKIFMITSIILSAIIPILTLLLDNSHNTFIKIIIITISSTITSISAISTLYNYKDFWIQYRTNCELLKSILFRYFTQSGEYKNIDEQTSYEMLVMSCEEYMTKEFQTWLYSNIDKKNNQSSTNS